MKKLLSNINLVGSFSLNKTINVTLTGFETLSGLSKTINIILTGFKTQSELFVFRLKQSHSALVRKGKKAFCQTATLFVNGATYICNA